MKNKIFKKPAFTLIELMVVVTIVSILMLASYIPYAYHQKKTLLRQAAREVSQSLSDARNLAIHGLDTGSGNISLALYIPEHATEIQYYTYPYTETPNILSLKSEYLYRIKKLPKGTQIDEVNNIVGPYMFVFQAISGSGSVGGDVLPITISYLGALDPVLQAKLEYYPQSYISDY